LWGLNTPTLLPAGSRRFTQPSASSPAMRTMPFTFAALATAILHADAVPTFADIGRKTLNLDSASVKFTDTAKTVVVVHLAGYPAEMDAFMKLADRYGL
jgi:perosamine synthetase